MMHRAVALLLLLSTTWGAESELERLVRELGEPNYARRDLAYKELQKRRDPKAVPLIVKAIPGWPLANQNLGVLLIAALPPKTAHPALRKLAKSADPHLRLTAATQLHLRGQPKQVGVMVRALRAPGIDEKRIASMVSRVRNLRVPAIYDAVRELIRPEREAMTLYQVLKDFGLEDYGGAKPEARALLEDKRGGVRAVALAYLIRFGESDRAPELARAIEAGETDVSSFGRVRVLMDRAPAGKEVVLASVAARCREETNALLAANMMDFLAGQRFREAIPILKELVEDEDTQIARAAFVALTRLSAAPDRDAVERLLESDDSERALMAARVLRRMDDLSGLPVVLRIAREEADLRLDAIKALGEFRHADAVDLLIDNLMDEDQTVRSYASSALRNTLRTLFPYRRIDLDAAGYDARRSEAERRAAVERIRAWWNAHRDAEW